MLRTWILKRACVSTLLQSLGLRAYEETIEKQGLKLLSFPIVEMACPTSMKAVMLFLDEVAHLMTQGSSVAMHCRGGVGRAGMMAACLLILLELCKTPEQAIAEVSIASDHISAPRLSMYIYYSSQMLSGALKCWMTVQGPCI